MHCSEKLNSLTDAEEGSECDALPPPVREPEECPGERGVPGRGQGDEAQEVAREQGFDGGAEGEDKRAEEDVAEDVSGGPERVFLEKLPGNGVVDLLECDRGGHVRPGEPISRVVSASSVLERRRRRRQRSHAVASTVARAVGHALGTEQHAWRAGCAESGRAHRSSYSGPYLSMVEGGSEARIVLARRQKGCGVAVDRWGQEACRRKGRVWLRPRPRCVLKYCRAGFSCWGRSGTLAAREGRVKRDVNLEICVRT